MKTYVIDFVEEVTSQVKIQAKNLKEAEKIVYNGDFIGDEVIDRDHFQITGSYEEWTEEAKEGAKIAGSIGLSLDDDSGDMAEELKRIMNNDQ